MNNEVRLTVKELAEGLSFDPYYGDGPTVEKILSETLRDVYPEEWPTKHLGPRFRLVLAWIAWSPDPLPTYVPGSEIPIPTNQWEGAFKGYKATWPQLGYHGKKFEFLTAEVRKEELREFLIVSGLPLPSSKNGIPAKWFFSDDAKDFGMTTEKGGTWLTGEELLRSDYQGDKRKFHNAIREGKIVPRNYYGEKYGSGRIFPEHISKIQGKAQLLERDNWRLASDDEMLLREKFCSQNDITDFEEPGAKEQLKAYLESEEAKELRATIPNKRLQWEASAKRLRAEIGDPEKVLSPDVVWRDVTFTPELQEKLLNAFYRVESGDDAAKPSDQFISATEQFPGEPGELRLIGWREICPHVGLKVGKDGKKPKGMDRHIKAGFPLMRIPLTNKPYTYLSQIKKYCPPTSKK